MTEQPGKTNSVETVLVVGGGSGIGRACAFELGRRGKTVFVADKDVPAARAVAKEIQQEGGRSEAFPVDVSQSASVGELFGSLRSQAERLDYLVHAAGILGKTANAWELTDSDWRTMMSVNLDGAFYCLREATRWMVEQKSGRIALVSSVASLVPTPGALHYSAAKGGLSMMGKTWAQEVARHNIRVNVVAPGYIQTPLLEDVPPRFLESIIKRTPLRRLGEPEEIAGLVAFLASQEADFFTGQVLSPNGGLVI